MMWKTLFSIGALLGGASNALAQAGTALPVGTYAFTATVPVVECDFAGTPVGLSISAPEAAKFRYLQTTADSKSAIIQFLLWSPNDPNFRLFNYSAAKQTERKTFCVDRAIFDRFSQQIFAYGRSSYELAAGALVLPVKMRFGGRDRSFDFSKDITISTTGGFRWRLSETRDNYLNALIGVGLSSVGLNADNTRGVIKESTDRAALTWIGGVMFDVNKFQFGAFLGQDRISQPNQADWTYHGKTWLAVGLGYSLFGQTTAKENKTEKQ